MFDECISQTGVFCAKVGTPCVQIEVMKKLHIFRSFPVLKSTLTGAAILLTFDVLLLAQPALLVSPGGFTLVGEPEVTPQSVDLSNGESASVTVHFTIDESQNQAGAVSVAFEDEEERTIAFGSGTLVSREEGQSRWESTVSVPPTAAAGDYRLVLLVTSSDFTAFSEISTDMFLTVLGGDTKAPQLSGEIQSSRDQYSLDEGTVSLEVTFDLIDEGSGVEEAVAFLKNQDGINVFSASAQLIAGDGLAGTWQAQIELNPDQILRFAPEGDLSFALLVQDQAGNFANIETTKRLAILRQSALYRFQVDMSVMGGTGLFRPRLFVQEGMSLHLEVFNGPNAGTSQLFGFDVDEPWLTEVELDLNQEIQYAFVIDPNGDGINSGDWVYERYGEENPRTLAIGQTEKNLPVVFFHDREEGFTDPDHRALEVMNVQPGGTRELDFDEGDQTLLVSMEMDEVLNPALISVRRYARAPSGQPPSSEFELNKAQFWVIDSVPELGSNGTIVFDYGSLHGIQEPSALRLFHRLNHSEPWRLLPSTVDTDQGELQAEVSELIGHWTVGTLQGRNTLEPELPGLVSGPSPADGAVGVDSESVLSWQAAPKAEAYDLYLWRQEESQPNTPISSGLETPSFPLNIALVQRGNHYHWQVVAKNIDGDTSGPVWSFSATALPDLQAVSLNSPGEARAGQSMEVDWVVENVGGVGTFSSFWRDALFLSSDTVYDPEDQRLGSVRNLSALAAGESYRNSTSVVLPVQFSGTYHLLLIANHGSGQQEDDLENNTVSAPLIVRPAPRPDLVITDFRAPHSAFSGEMAFTSWQVENQGNGATLAAQWEDRLYLSQDAILDEETDILLSTELLQRPLTPGDSYTIDAPARIPPEFSGSFHWILQIDAKDQLFELAGASENQQSQEVDITLAPPPDLEVTGIDVSGFAVAGQRLEATWQVRNNGPGELQGAAWTDRLFLSPQAVWDPETSIPLKTVDHHAGLALDEVYQVQRSVLVPSHLTGTFYPVVQTDSSQAVFEFEFEQNNILVGNSAIEISPPNLPDLKPAALTAPATTPANSTVHLSWRVENQGTLDAPGGWKSGVYLLPQPEWELGNAVLLDRFGHPNSIAAGKSVRLERDVHVPFDLSGEFYFFVVADDGNAVMEGPWESNNRANSEWVTIDPYPRPDLNVDDVAGPSSAPSGQTITVHWTVSNLGDGDTIQAGWADALYLSVNEQLDPESDILLVQTPRNSSLTAGASYSSGREVMLPEHISGEFYLIIQADSQEQLLEVTRDNNTASGNQTISVSAAPTVDLTIDHIAVTGTPVAGRTSMLEWRVNNAGQGEPAQPWFDAVYLSRDRTLGITDFKLKALEKTPPLPGGESYTRSTEIRWPPFFSGNAFVLVQADSADHLFERDGEGNNVSALEIELPLAPLSDLVIDHIEFPSQVRPGEAIEVAWRLANQGDNTAQGFVREAVYLSADTQWDLEDPLLGVNDRFIDVQAGQGVQASTVLNLENVYSANQQAEIQELLPAIVSGEYHVIVRADTRNAVRESDEENNTEISATTMSAVIPELAFDAPTSFQLRRGESVYYQVQVTDPAESLFPNVSSTLRIRTKSDTQASNEIHVRYGEPARRSLSDFSANNRLEHSLNLPVPASRPGVYYLLIHSEEILNSEAQEITITVRRESFSLTAVSPSSGGRNRQVTLKLKGTAIAPATKPLLRQGTREYEAVETFWYSPLEMWATFDLTGILKGTYDVVLQLNQANLSFIDEGTHMEAVIQESQAEAMAEGAFVVEDPITVPPRIFFQSPSALVPNSRFGITIRVENRSNHDIQSPLLLVYGTPGFAKKLPDEQVYDFGSRLVLPVATEGPAGILAAGGEGFAHMEGFAPRDAGTLTVAAAPVENTGLPFDIEQLLSRIGFTGGTLPEWETAIAEIKERSPTWADYNTLLADKANDLNRAGIRQSNGRELLESVFSEVATSHGTFPASFPPQVQQQRQGKESSEDFLRLMNSGADCGTANLEFQKLTLASAAAAFEGYCGGGSGAATDHLNHFLFGNGSDRHYGPNSDVAQELRAHTGANTSFEYIVSLLEGPIKAELKRALPQDGCSPGFTGQMPDMNVSDVVQDYSGSRPETYDGSILGPGTGCDLKLGFGGFNRETKAWLSNIQYGFQQCPDCEKPGKGFFRAQLNLMFRDTYRFDATDASRHSLTGMGHNLENCGAAQPFNTSITMTEWIGGTFHIPKLPEDQCEEPPEPPPLDLPFPLISGPWPEIDIPIPVSRDPNDIIGPAGVGEEKFVSIHDTLRYRIRFENDPDLATAPAQTVSIRQKLDDTLDLRSFRIGSFGFRGLEFVPGKPTAVYQERLDLTEEFGLFVEVNAGLDIENHEVFWNFASIDPETGERPADPFLGFLPLNDEHGSGEGFATYEIRPSPDSNSSDKIQAQARIVFDINEPIDTPVVTNTIDAQVPQVRVDGLNKAHIDSEFEIAWSGEDDPLGSGWKNSNIYVSVNQNPPILWLEATSKNSAVFRAEAGHRYDFFAVGQDYTGNQADLPVTPNASTFVTGEHNFYSWINETTSLPLDSWNPGADPDGDRISNFIEYVLGTNAETPTQEGTRLQPRVEILEGRARLVILINLPELRPDAALVVSRSTDLRTWTPVEEQHLSRTTTARPDGSLDLQMDYLKDLQEIEFLRLEAVPNEAFPE